MVQRVATVAFEGIEVRPVDVQVQVAPGMPAFAIVGLPDKAVSEARERVSGAPDLVGKRAIGQSLRQMHAADFVGAVEIGERARNAQHAMIAARREPHRIGGFAQQRKSAAVRPRHIFQYRARHRGIGPDMRQPDRGVPRGLAFARQRDALGDFAAAFGRRW